MKVTLQSDESIEIEYTPRLRALDAHAERMEAKYHGCAERVSLAARPVVAPPVAAVPPTLAGRAGAEKGAA